MTTTAFCTVDRVTSAGRERRDEASSCREQDMPKREVGGISSRAGRRSVKYEKSSVELRDIHINISDVLVKYFMPYMPPTRGKWR